MDIVTVNKLIYDYPNKRALDNVSFSIPDGAVVALVGPNGAGKSTLMRCLVGLDTPLYGSIHINNIDVIASPRECHRIAGYLSDFFGVYDDLTIKQHLLYIADSYGISDVETRITQTLTDVDLTQHADKAASELSRGLRQRLGIAMAIIHQPKVLILDEPASGLDPEARHSLSQLFTRLNRSGMTIISSSHILAELSEYSSHMLIIENSRVIGITEVGPDQNMQNVYMHILQEYRKGEKS